MSRTASTIHCHATIPQVDDELKKMRNPLLMTARQRALLDKRSGDDSLESFPAEPLLALPSGETACLLRREGGEGGGSCWFQLPSGCL